MADIKISQLPAALTVSDADVLVINQGGVTKRATRNLVRNAGTVSSISAGTGLSGGTITTSGTIALATPVAIANGGTGATTAQAAMDALAGATTSGQYLRGNGVDVVMSAIQAADVPTLNQSTTGTAANVTGTVAVANGGTNATTAQAAISNLGIGMRMVEAQTTANITGNMVGNVFTVTATGVFATDGYTPVLGDIIAFALQTTTTQNGFWEVTTVGAVGVSAVFTRPSWYTGVVKNSMYMTRFGSAQNGFVQTFVGPTGTGNTEITVGTTNITMIRVNLRASPASLGSNVFTGPQTLRANGSGAQNCPLIFQSGVALMGTPVGNAVEWFNDQLFLTTAAGVRTTNTTHVAIPATSTSAGLVGQVAVDNANNWLYVCTATNVWKRTALTTF
jgi:hypothetical protein